MASDKEKRFSSFVAWGLLAFFVVVMLVGLLLPASQTAREAGRRGHWDESRGEETHLTQIGAAFSNADATQERFMAAGFVTHASSAPTEAPPTAESIVHKIVYSASVQLAVEKFDAIPERVAALAKESGAYIADSKLSGNAGTSREGTWKVRVPVARFDEFLAGAKKLGEVIEAGTTSQDVSEEYYDVEARIRNKTKEEERLLKLLEERPGKLEDVIAIERELSRVREELERMQGRMRVLTDLTSLTTVNLTIREIHNYQPPSAPALATRLDRGFHDSLDALTATGANLLVAGAALAPWLPVAVVIVGAPLMVARKRRREAARKQDSP